MCEAASMVVTKKKIYWSKSSDSHEDIIQEFDLQEQNIRGEINFVRVEIVPPDRNYSLPPSQWKYSLDQDLKPDWYDEKEVENRVRIELKNWIKQKVIKKGKRKIKAGERVYACDDSTVEAFGNSKVYAHDNSTVYAHDNSIVEAYYNSKVKAFDNSIVDAFGNSTVYAYGDSKVYAHDNSTVYAYGDSTVKAFGDSKVYAYGDSTVYAYGDSIVKAFDNSTVEANGNSTVEANGNSTVISYKNMSPDILKSPYAVLTVKDGDQVKHYQW